MQSPEEKTPREALYSLLLDLFEVEEFSNWLQLGPDTDIVLHLPGKGTPPAVFFTAVVGVLNRHGRINPTFFARLRLVRGYRSPSIMEVAKLWGFSDHDEIEPQRPSSNSTSLTRDRTVLPGQTLAGRYLIVSDIGQGGVGHVWQARDILSGDTVAIKILNPSGAQPDPARRAIFFRGAQAMTGLNHPAIVRIRDPRPDPGDDPYDFYVMDFVDAPDLSKLYRKTPRTDDETIEAMLAIGDGIAAAHRKRIIHRDLKPSNILRNVTTRQVHIIDFDTAKDLNSMTMTRSGEGLASAFYTAPEVLMSLNPPPDGAPSPDERADIYSLAVIGIFLRTGRDPAHFNLPMVISRIDCSTELKQVLARGCAHAATDRYPTIDEMMSVLRSIQAKWQAAQADSTNDHPSKDIPLSKSSTFSADKTIRPPDLAIRSPRADLEKNSQSTPDPKPASRTWRSAAALPAGGIALIAIVLVSIGFYKELIFCRTHPEHDSCDTADAESSPPSTAEYNLIDPQNKIPAPQMSANADAEDVPFELCESDDDGIPCQCSDVLGCYQCGTGPGIRADFFVSAPTISDSSWIIDERSNQLSAAMHFGGGHWPASIRRLESGGAEFSLDEIDAYDIACGVDLNADGTPTALFGCTSNPSGNWHIIEKFLSRKIKLRCKYESLYGRPVQTCFGHYLANFNFNTLSTPNRDKSTRRDYATIHLVRKIPN